MAATGNMKCPSSVVFFNPPHFPRKKTHLGLTHDNKSIIVAALELPMPKLIMLNPWELVDEVMGPPNPLMGTSNFLANFST
jgi:hypothetical protein